MEWGIVGGGFPQLSHFENTQVSRCQMSYLFGKSLKRLHLFFWKYHSLQISFVLIGTIIYLL